MKGEIVTSSIDSPGKVFRPDLTDNLTVPQITLVSTDNHSDGNNESLTAIKHSTFSKKCKEFLESSPVVITMSIATVYALFGDDIKTLGFPKSADNVFSSLVVICLFLFTTELVFSFILKEGYKWSFYFWLDLIATLSLIPDIGWMWDAALGLNSGNSSGRSVKDAGNASRAGARTARVFRIIRIVRLIRIVKLYKNTMITLERKKKEKKKLEEQDELLKDLPISSESKVGNKMSEVTMRRVIVIVMAMLFILPLFETDFYFNFQTSWEYGLVEVRDFYDMGGYQNVTDKYIDFHKDDIRPLVYLRYLREDKIFTWEGDTPYHKLRYNEIYYTSTGEFISIFDTRYDAKLTSLLNIMRTIFICVILTMGSVYFSKDSDTLVIKPIEKMIEKVKIIAKNPIAAAEIQELYNNQEESEPSSCFSSLCKSKSSSNQYETQLLENTIMKIGVLLALGFGEAGSLIIGSNVEKGGEMDPMIEGSKVVGIYGFCDIRNFTDTTEELQEGVMMFVNEIAQVVHGVVDKYLGAANKNIGDAFLLVWKFSQDEFFLEDDNKIVRNPESVRARYLPDLSLLSFLKIMAKVNKDPAMLRYRTNQKLLARMPGYEIKMGFGLHLGWSIEGAIGSQFKIDASYLSPNVNVASALEASTKLYGVPLLISGTLYDVFSEPVQKFCRQVDRVFIRGHSDPLPLFTSDCEFFEFTQGKQADRSKSFFRKKRKMLKRDLEKMNITTETLYIKSKEIRLMKKHFTSDFFQMFDEAFQFYLNGSWSKAKLAFEQVLTIRKKDGPTQALLGFMAEFGFICPNDWKQVRNLT